jgi:hypothetical protein
MQQRRETDFSVDHPVIAELIHQVQRYPTQVLLGLHQVDGADGTGDIVGQVGAFGGRHKVAAVGFPIGIRLDFAHNVETQGAVQMEMEFNFGQLLKFARHGSFCFLL